MDVAPTIEPLAEAPRTAIDRVASGGFRFAQLSATQRGTRPRELDRSARRDLLATMRRREVRPSGLDLWIPPSHFTEAGRVDRAVATVIETLELAAELGGVPVSLTLPRGDDGLMDDVPAALAAAAQLHGARIADHGWPPRAPDHEAIGVGLDPVTLAEHDADPTTAPLELGARLVSARLCRRTADGARAPVGDGVGLDVQAYRVALSVAAADRPVVIDARQWSDPWAGVLRSAAAWQSAGRITR